MTRVLPAHVFAGALVLGLAGSNTLRLGIEPRLASGSQFERTFGYLVEHAPSFSLRGGTREVLRGIIARGLGLR